MKCNETQGRKIPDFSGKYYGKLNDKKIQNDGKTSNKCNCRKKVSSEKSFEFKGKA